MISLRQWREHLEGAALRVEAQITVAVAAHAQFCAKDARDMIGHLQGPVAAPPPVPMLLPAWEPLASATVDDKTRLGFTGPDYQPLERTGQMESSILGVSVGHTGAVVSDDPVMVHHEFGTMHMPPRPVLARSVISNMPLLQMTLGRIAADALNPESAVGRGRRP